MNIKNAIAFLKEYKDIDATIQKRGKSRLLINTEDVEVTIPFENACDKATINLDTLLKLLKELNNEWECKVEGKQAVFKYNNEIVLKANNHSIENKPFERTHYVIEGGFKVNAKVKQFLKNIKDNMVGSLTSYDHTSKLYIQNGKVYFVSNKSVAWVETDTFKKDFAYQISKKTVIALLKCDEEEFEFQILKHNKQKGDYLFETPEFTNRPAYNPSTAQDIEKLVNNITKEDEIRACVNINFNKKVPQIKKDEYATFLFDGEEASIVYGGLKKEKIVLNITNSNNLQSIKDLRFTMESKEFNLFMKQTFEANETARVTIYQRADDAKGLLKLESSNAILGAFHAE